MTSITKKTIGAGLAAILALAIAVPSWASLGGQGYSETEKVGFAFFTLGGVTPDFDSWAADTLSFAEAEEVDRSRIRINEGYRLQQGFANYESDKDFFYVQVPVKLSIPRDGSRVLQFWIPQGRGNDSEVFFSYKIMDLEIAVIPDGIDKYKNIQLTPQQYESFMKETRISPGQSRPAIMNLFLKPVAADANEPVTIGGAAFWPVMAEIGSLSFWDSKDNLLWSYEAPWFVTNDRRDLLDLYKKK